MRRGVLCALGCLLALPARAEARILLVARDLEEHTLPGICFAYGGVISQRTNPAGATELDLPPEHRTGQQIKLQVMLCSKSGSKRAEDWFLINPQINIPSNTAPAEVVLMRRSTFRQIAAEGRDAPRAAARGSDRPTEEDQKRALVAAAARRGLSPAQLESAIRSFAETQDPKDRGIAAYLEGHYAKAEEFLRGAAEKKVSDVVETLRYLGATQFEQAKYQEAADSFRKALALRSEDAVLLSWLGMSLYSLARWAEAEPLVRRALEIDESSYGKEHPNIARDLNNLASLLQVTNRLAEAEPLIRRALDIDEKCHGREHPAVATSLNNLASLLQATNRLAEAEPLMRRALDIDEKCYGKEDLAIARDLNNLAQLLEATNRLAEAEPLMRRALDIDQKSYGKEHPNVAIRLNNLASLLEATNRLAEAEPLMRRALDIDQKSYGKEHPKVAIRLNNLAQLLQATNRLAEAEPLMRRALDIDEKSYGKEHLNVAIRLHNLAKLLQATNRLTEADPLMRRGLVIFIDFSRRTGHEHPHLRDVIADYDCLLAQMGRSQAEIEEAIQALLASPE